MLSSHAASCCSNCMLLQSIRCAYTLNSARLKTVLAQCQSDVSSVVTSAMRRLVFHPVCLTAGKFFWFLLYTYLTQIYFTFFGESLKLCLTAHKLHCRHKCMHHACSRVKLHSVHHYKCNACTCVYMLYIYMYMLCICICCICICCVLRS